MQEKSGRESRKNKKLDNMNQRVAVMINATEKKYICIDKKATLEYEFIEAGGIYNEALVDIQGNYNRIPEHCILLLIHGQPFYVKKEFICRIDKERDETRKTALCGTLMFLN